MVQARKALTEAPFPTPRPWIRRVLQALNLAKTSQEVAWQVEQAAGLGRSWLTHAWVAFESPKEGKRQKGEIPIPGAWFLEWLDSRSHGDVPVP